MTHPKPANDHGPIAAQHFVVICRDAEQSADLRAATLAAHRTHIDDWAARIAMSGPLVDDDGERRTGQFYVLVGDSRTDAKQFAEEDPFTIAGVFTSIEIMRMLPRYQYGTRHPGVN